MKKLYSSLSFCLFGILGLIAQPNFTSSDVLPSIGEEFESHSFDPSGLGSYSPGANQVWDFSTLSSTASYTATVYDASSTPYAADFPDATYAMDQAGYYVYYEADSTQFSFLGQEGPDLSLIYSDADNYIQFPVTYEDTHTDDFDAVIEIADVGPYPIYHWGTSTVEADGYGTLILPWGSYEDVLRIKISQSYNDSMFYIIQPVEQAGSSDLYFFFKEGTHNALLNYGTLNIMGVPYPVGVFLDSSSINVPNTDTLAINDLSSTIEKIFAYPTIVKNSETVYLNIELKKAANVNVSVTNVMGQTIENIFDDRVNTSLRVINYQNNNLSKGVYYFNITIDGQRTSQKFLVQ